MEVLQPKASQDPTLVSRGDRNLIVFVAEVLLRTLVVGSTLTAACLMLTSKETAIVFGFPFVAKYSYEPAFRFFAYANVVACVLSLMSLPTVFFLHHQWSYFFLFLHDLVMVALGMAACGAASAIGEVGTNGNHYTAWMPICHHFMKFCNRIRVSVIFSYLAVVIFLVLTVLSAFRMQARPISSSSSSV